MLAVDEHGDERVPGGGDGRDEGVRMGGFGGAVATYAAGHVGEGMFG